MNDEVALLVDGVFSVSQAVEAAAKGLIAAGLGPVAIWSNVADSQAGLQRMDIALLAGFGTMMLSVIVQMGMMTFRSTMLGSSVCSDEFDHSRLIRISCALISFVELGMMGIAITSASGQKTISYDNDTEVTHDNYLLTLQEDSGLFLAGLFIVSAIMAVFKAYTAAVEPTGLERALGGLLTVAELSVVVFAGFGINSSDAGFANQTNPMHRNAMGVSSTIASSLYGIGFVFAIAMAVTKLDERHRLRNVELPGVAPAEPRSSCCRRTGISGP